MTSATTIVFRLHYLSSRETIVNEYILVEASLYLALEIPIPYSMESPIKLTQHQEDVMGGEWWEDGGI